MTKDIGRAILNFLIKRRAREKGITEEEAEREIIRKVKEDRLG